MCPEVDDVIVNYEVVIVALFFVPWFHNCSPCAVCFLLKVLSSYVHVYNKL